MQHATQDAALDSDRVLGSAANLDGGDEDVGADTGQEARSRAAVAAGVAQLDATLGLGTSVTQPPAGGGRGPTIAPPYWLEQQRARRS